MAPNDKEVAELYKRNQEKLGTLQKNRKNYGYCHFDLALTNVMFHSNKLTIIDFSAVFCFLLIDVAALFLHIHEARIPPPVFRRRWRTFWSAYNQQTTPEANWLECINLLFAMRGIALYLIVLSKRLSGNTDRSDFLLPEWRKSILENRMALDIEKEIQ